MNDETVSPRYSSHSLSPSTIVFIFFIGHFSPEQQRSDADHGRSFGDGGLEIVAHPHGQVPSRKAWHLPLRLFPQAKLIHVLREHRPTEGMWPTGWIPEFQRSTTART